MPETLQRSLYHAADRQTLRHCVALVRWEHGEYSTHYEVHPQQSGPAHPPRPLTYYHQGDYFPTLAAAREAFAARADAFEGRYWKHLEAA